MPESMRDTLEETFKQIEEREEEVVEPESETLEPEAEEAAEAEKEATPEAPIEKLPDAPVEKIAEKAKPAEKRDTTLANPPVTWTAKAKSQWATLPDDIKKEIRKREQDALNGITQYKEKAVLGERLDKTIQPYQAFLKARGATAERVVEDALNLSYSLTNSTPQQRGEILRKIAKQYGADLSEPSPEQQKADQVIQPLLNKIENLERAMQNSVESPQQREQRELAAYEQQVNAFAAETDETGALKRPYFNEVAPFMKVLIESGHAKQLDDAYVLAVKAHPEISLLVQSAETLKKKDQDDARAEKARRNNQVNFQRRPNSTSKDAAPQGSMRETIEAAYNRIQSA